MADLTFSRCFVQSVSSRGRNEVIPMELKRQHPYLSGHLRQENKIRKIIEIAAFKVKSRNLPVLTFVHSDLNIWSYRSSMKTQFFGLLTNSPINYQNFSQKRYHMREIWVSKDDSWILPTNRFREGTCPNYVLKHLNRRLSFCFINLAPLSQSLKI